MENKFLLICSLIAILISFNTTNAAAQKNNSTTSVDNQVQTKEQVRITNEGDGSEIKVDKPEQEKVTETQNTNRVQTQDRQEIQDGTRYGYGVQSNENKNMESQDDQQDNMNINSQNQVKAENQIEDSNQVETYGTTNNIAEQRRSQVANAVQQMLQVADRNGGIGEQVRTIAQIQTKNQDKIETSLQKIENRKGIAKFLIGPNYREINNAQKLLDQNKQQIQQLNEIKNQLSNQSDIQNLTQQIQTLEQSNSQIQNSLAKSKSGFNLFGWVFRLFSK